MLRIRIEWWKSAAEPSLAPDPLLPMQIKGFILSLLKFVENNRAVPGWNFGEAHHTDIGRSDH